MLLLAWMIHIWKHCYVIMLRTQYNRRKVSRRIASMKKLISSRQRQYLANYLLNLKTQAETFHVINILWFSIKLYYKFRSFNICSLFSAGRNYEGAKRSLQYMSHKNIWLPKSSIHCPCMTFSMEKIRSSVPYSC